MTRILQRPIADTLVAERRVPPSAQPSRRARWAPLALAALAACARHESSQLAAQPAPTSGSAGSAQAGSAQAGSSASAAAAAPPAADPEAARREAIRRKAQELIDGIEQDERKQQAAGKPGAEPTPTQLLGTYTQADVARAVAPGADASLNWRSAEWHAQKDTIVALSYRHAEFGTPPAALEPRLVLVQARAGKLVPTAEKKLDLSKASCRNESGEAAGGEDRAPELALDLAHYDIAPGQTAIGVRFTCAYTFPAGEGSDTRLLLLELRDGALHQVFDERIAHTNFDRPTGNENSATGSLSVLREQHAGHFDLELRTKTKTEGSPSGASPNTAGKPSERTETARFVWDGSRYVPAKP
jgi:hypothetical protein